MFISNHNASLTIFIYAHFYPFVFFLDPFGAGGVCG